MKTLLPLALLTALIQNCGAVIFAYEEASDGDLGENHLMPRIFNPTAGASTLTGTVSGQDRDLFTLVIGSGLSLESLYLLSYDSPRRNPANLSYLLSQPGATLTAPPSNNNIFPGGAIGYVGFGEWAEGRNILRIVTAGPPYENVRTLEEGSYAFWINETTNSADYSFQFNVIAIPEPSSLVLCISAIPLLIRRRRK